MRDLSTRRNSRTRRITRVRSDSRSHYPRVADIRAKLTDPTSTFSPAMSLEESRRSQRPYRYGMILLCVGALINWLGLAENYVEPVRYIGVACIVAGALLICAAMCCWLHAPPTRTHVPSRHASHPITAQIDDPIHVISIDEPACGSRQKPPDYEAVADAPPSYDDAIKLDPGRFVRLQSDAVTQSSNALREPGATSNNIHGDPTAFSSSSAAAGTAATITPTELTAPTPPPPYAR